MPAPLHQPAASGPASALPRGVVVLLGMAGLVVTVTGIRNVAGIAAPVFLALVLAIVVHPAHAWLRRRGAPRWAAVGASMLLLYAIVLGLAALLLVSLAQLAELAPDYAGRSAELTGTFQQALQDRLGMAPEQAATVGEWTDPGRLLDLAGGLLGTLLGALSSLAFLVTLLFFMSIDAGGFDERLAAISRQRPEIAAALSSFTSGTRRYLVVCTVFGLVVAVLDTVALIIIGISLPVLWGLLSFVTNYIPNIGFVIGLLPPAILALLDGGVPEMLLVIAVYCVINFILQSIIQPKFVGDSVGLSVTITFLALVFWSWAIGALGALLAIPLTLLAKALLVDIDPGARWMDSLIGRRPAPGAAAPTAPATRPAGTTVGLTRPG